MNLNNDYFPLRYLPDVVIFHIAQFLRPSDLGNMRRVSRHFRHVFSAPHFWKGIMLCMPAFATRVCVEGTIDIQVLDKIKFRRITRLHIYDVIHGFDWAGNIKVILQALPQLEMLSFDRTTPAIILALEQAASSAHLNLTKLDIGSINMGLILPIKDYRYFIITDLVLKLQKLEEMRCAGVEYQSIGCFRLQVGSDLQRALCCSGKLTSVSLFNVREICRSCLYAIMNNNPHLQTLSLRFVHKFVEDDEMNSTQYSSLTSLNLSANGPLVTEKLLSWACPGAEPNRSLTSLDISGFRLTVVSPVLTKLPALRKLNLNHSNYQKGCMARSFRNLENLEWLSLHGCTTGADLRDLSDLVGKTLRHLSLIGLTRITKAVLRDLASMFPLLRTLDLSGCVKISDAFLVQWYNKNDETRWPKIRKLVLKGCNHITQEVINSVRLKTRNQLQIVT